MDKASLPPPKARNPQLAKRYRAVPFREYRHCRLCDAPLGRALIDLPDFPMTEIYVDKPMGTSLARLDQQVCQCDTCGHVQLRRTIPGDFLYGQNYATRTSGSSAKKAIDDFLDFVTPNLPQKIPHLLEIGCNDLYTLEKLAPRAERLHGIDPIWIGRDTALKASPRITVQGDYISRFEPSLHGGAPDVVICSHTLEHIDEALALIESLLRHSQPGARLFFQFPGLEPLLKDLRFDQVHQQHLNYFSVESVLHLLEKTGGELVDFGFNYNHWGALMIYFRKASKARQGLHRAHRRGMDRFRRLDIQSRFQAFHRTMQGLNAQLENLIADREWIGYGAALMLPLLAYHIPALGRLQYVIDDDPGKQGRTYINLPLKIVSSASAGSLTGRSVVVTAINSKQNVRALTEKLIEAGVRDLFLPTNTL